MSNPPLPINPAVLKWAREEAGLSLEDAAARAKITSLLKKRGEPERSPADRLHSWETGEDTPSLRQLEKLAKGYHRPLITFFLAAPPLRRTSLADFRTFANQRPIKDTPEFSALKRRIEAMHEELKDIAAQEGFSQLPFIGSIKPGTPVTQFVVSMRLTLGFSFADQQRMTSKEDLLRKLREKAHDAGVFVVFEGDLGSYHSKILPEEYRGLALAHPTVPLVAINPNDAKAAQLFTLVHELAHLWLGESGVTNYDALGGERSRSAGKDCETLCNAVASEFLVPEKAIRARWRPDNEDLGGKIGELARGFKVSRAVIARRLLDLKIITDAEYKPLLTLYQAQWKNNKQKQTESVGNPTRNDMDKYRLGRRLLSTVLDAADNGKITLQEAARILHVPASRFNKVA